MFRKKRQVGIPFKSGFNSFRSSGSPSVLSTEETISFKRFDKNLVSRVLNNTQQSLHQLAGVRLRPSNPNQEFCYSEVDSQSNSNDIVDLTKLGKAHSEALSQHTTFVLSKKKPSTRHTPRLKLEKIRNQGFGVEIYYRCSQCSFRSTKFKLYETTASGACLTNVQAAVGLGKITIKSSDANFLFATLNLNGPSQTTLQHHFTKVNEASSKVLESALVRNRGIVRDYVAIQNPTAGPVPAVAVAFDGQYDVPLYHGYDGKSNSVSEPVLEAETGMNLMVSHAVVSKLDGTYEKDKVGMSLWGGGWGVRI